MNNLEPFDTLPIIGSYIINWNRSIFKSTISTKTSYQGEVRQVIDCISPRNAGIVGFINGEPYYGAFHVMPQWN